MPKENEYLGLARKSYQELTFTDDFMFRKVMRNNEALCRGVIELLLDVKIREIVYKDDNHEIDVGPNSKGIRVDVYLEDEAGTVFDLEMQNTDLRNLPRRARYYQSIIDRDNLGKSIDYESLPNSYIVFICTFDPYGAGRAKYEFRELCIDDTGIELGDGASKVFINAKSKSRDVTGEMRAFLDYLCGEEASSDLTRNIESDILQAKAVSRWEVEYMTFADELRLERKYAFAEGHEARGFEAVDALVAEGTFDAARACEILGVDLDAYEKHLKTGGIDGM